MALGLGSSSLGIGLAIHLRDHFTMKANQVAASMNRLHKNANMAMRANLRAVRNIGIGMAAVGAMGIRAMVGWVKQGMEFQFTMDAVKAVANDTTATFEELKQKALEVGGSTVFTIKEVGGAMKYLGMAGFARKEIIGTIDAVTALGAATDTKIGGKGGAADMMTNMMTAFGLTADESMRTADILTAMTTSANVDISSLHEALKYSASDFTALNMSFEESAAAIAMLGNAGIQGSVAGTAMGNMLRQLTKAMTDFGTKRQAKGLGKFGLIPADVMDEKGNMLELTKVMDTFYGKLGKMGNIEALASLQAIVGIRGARGLIPLIREIKMGKTLGELVDIAKFKSAGEALRIAAARMDNIKGDTLLLKSAWSEFTARFTDAITPLIRVVLKGLTKIVKFLSKVASNKWGKALLIGVAAFTILLTVAGAFLAILGTIGLGLKNSIVSFKAMKMAGVWAWNSMAAAAARYGAVAQGASWMGRGGVYTKKGVKGFQSSKGVGKAAGRGGLLSGMLSTFGLGAGSRMAGGAGAAASKGIKGFVGGLGKATPILFKLGRLGSIIGLVSLALEAMGIGLGDIFSGLLASIGYGIESLINGIKLGIASMFPGLGMALTGGKSWSEMNQEARARWFNEKSVGALTNVGRPGANAMTGAPDYQQGDNWKRALGFDKEGVDRHLGGYDKVQLIVNVAGEKAIEKVVDLKAEKEVTEETHEIWTSMGQ